MLKIKKEVIFLKKSLTLLLTTCILLTGCSKTDLKEVGKNLETTKNYSTSISLNVKSQINDVDSTYKRIKKVNIDNINGTAKVDSKMIINDIEKDETYYIKTKDNNAITYKEKDGIFETIEEIKDQNSLYYITAYVNENSEVVQEEKTENGIKFTIKLKKDRVKSFLNSYYDSSLKNNGKYKVVNDALLKVLVSKNGIIKSLEADFLNSIKYENVKNKITEFKLKIDYSNFNKNKEVKIPKKILESSLDSNLAKIRQYVTDFIIEVNNLELGNQNITNKFGYSLTSSDLTIVDNSVQNGIVILNGYTVEINNNQVGIPVKK